MKAKHWIGTLFVILLLLPWAALAAPVGKITGIQGTVDITMKGTAARNANIGDAVNVGDFIRTKSKSKAEITFNEGNILKLAENSRVGITQYMSGPQQNASILSLFRGKIQNIVKTVGVGGRYEVHTPTSVSGVRGTHFFNFYLAGASGSIFLEGSGYGYAKNNPDDVKNITAGQGMFVPSATVGAQLRSVSNKQLDEMKNATDISGSSDGSGGSGSGGTGGTGGLGGTDPLLAGAGDIIVTPPPPPVIVTPPPPPPPVPSVTPGLKLSITPATGFTHRIDEGGAITGVPADTVTTSSLKAAGATAGKADKPAAGSTSGTLYSLKVEGGMTGTADNPAAGLINGTITTGSVVNSGLSGYMMGLPNAARTGARALISAIYVDNDGTAGFMVGPMTATFSAGAFSGTGLAYKYTPVISTSLTPATLAPVVFGRTSPGIGNIAIYPDAIYLGCSGGATCESESRGIVAPGGGVMGVWGAYSQGGSYYNSAGITSFANRRFMGYDATNKVIHYSENLTGAVDTAAREVSLSADFVYMDTRFIGNTTMNHFGFYDASNIYTSISSGTLQLVPLAFANVLEAPAPSFGVGIGGPLAMGFALNGLMGSTGDIWANASVPVNIFGKYIPFETYNIYSNTMKSNNYRQGSGNLTNDGKGAYAGFFNSILLLSSTNTIHADYQYLYADLAGNIGILRGTSSGPVYPGELGFKATGALNRIEMETGTGIDANTLITSGITSASYSGTTSNNLLPGGPALFVSGSSSEVFNIAGKKTWGISMTEVGGTYTGDPRGDAVFIYSIESGGTPIGAESVLAMQHTAAWNATEGGYFRSNVVGASADWSSAATFVAGGTIMGTFSPSASGTWTGNYLGTQIETTAFMALASTPAGQAKLAALNIPAVQVGTVSLSGSGGPWSSLNINNAGFYASTSGAKPQLWASNNISGAFTTNTNITSPVTLSGSAGSNIFNASFAIQGWNSATGNWVAAVTGGISPGLNGATQFKGAAAGIGATPTSGTITGTASGIVH